MKIRLLTYKILFILLVMNLFAIDTCYGFYTKPQMVSDFSKVFRQDGHVVVDSATISFIDHEELGRMTSWTKADIPIMGAALASLGFDYPRCSYIPEIPTNSPLAIIRSWVLTEDELEPNYQFYSSGPDGHYSSWNMRRPSKKPIENVSFRVDLDANTRSVTLYEYTLKKMSRINLKIWVPDNDRYYYTTGNILLKNTESAIYSATISDITFTNTVFNFPFASGVSSVVRYWDSLHEPVHASWGDSYIYYCTNLIQSFTNCTFNQPAVIDGPVSYEDCTFNSLTACCNSRILRNCVFRDRSHLHHVSPVNCTFYHNPDIIDTPDMTFTNCTFSNSNFTFTNCTFIDCKVTGSGSLTLNSCSGTLDLSQWSGSSISGNGQS